MSGGEAPGSDEKRPDSQTVAPKSTPATEPQADIAKGWPSVVESLKGIGIVLGSVGSVAALFYWFGFAVITSRLRVYDLFGIVRYTDEYVTEAGYQFFLDHLTFYQNPLVAFVILLVILVLFVAMPWGPFSRRTRYVDEQDTVSHRIVQWSQRGYFYLRDPHVGYSLFIVLALASVIFIVADLPLHFFRGRIDRQEKHLVEVQNVLDNTVLMFGPLPKHERSDNPALKDRRDHFIRTESLEQGDDARPWVTNTQSFLRRMFPDVMEETSPEDILKFFQKQLDISNEGPERLDNDFTSSVTYRTLRRLRVNEKINRELEIKTDAAVNLLRKLRQTLPERETDFFSIVRYTIYFQGANKALRDLEDLHTTIGGFFEPRTPETRTAWHHLEKVHPISFGQFFLSFSFWVLVGVFVYLLLNSPRLLKFAHWELLYFIALLMLFLASAVTLPTAYGKYRFDFKMMKLVGVAHREAPPREGSVGKKIDDLLNQNAKLYIFGSTKGNEVIMGAISPDLAPQIVIFEREAFTLVKVEPLRPGDVPYSQIGQLLGDVR